MVKTIIDSAFIKARSLPGAMEHNCTFLFGDLNFRVNLSNSTAREAINEKKFQHLLQYEELLQLRHARDQYSSGVTLHMTEEVKEALSQDLLISSFKEGEIKFPPTYKFDVGTHTYDTSRKQRIPSWTDRILYKDDSNRVKLLEYTSVPGVSMSDHKPVSAIFEVITKRFVSNQTNSALQSEYFQR